MSTATESTVALLVTEALAHDAQPTVRGPAITALRRISGDDVHVLAEARRRCLAIHVLDRQTRSRAAALLADARAQAGDTSR